MSAVSLHSLDSSSLAPGLGREIRAQFPAFAEYGDDLAYLDTAASSQKPKVVIDRLAKYLSVEHANIHRGAYKLSARATELYDQAREKVAAFVGAPSAQEIVFVRGATEGVNLVAHGIERQIATGDVILVSLLEHHSNIVPWQMLAERRGARVVFVNVTNEGMLDLEDLKGKLNAEKPKLLAITAVSNAIGTVVPLREVIAAAHHVGAQVLVDGAQALAHLELNVTALDIDYLVASGHKLYGPTGIGFLYGKASLLEKLDPFQGGGDMIAQVSIAGSSWAEVPRRFEAGTPAIGEAIAFGTALDFISQIGISHIRSHEDAVFEYGFAKLSAEEGVSVYGPKTRGGSQTSIISFTVDRVHPHDLGTIVDSHKVQIRAGHHCAMPLLHRLGLQSTARASVGVYSTPHDFDLLVDGIRAARKMFR